MTPAGLEAQLLSLVAHPAIQPRASLYCSAPPCTALPMAGPADNGRLAAMVGSMCCAVRDRSSFNSRYSAVTYLGRKKNIMIRATAQAGLTKAVRYWSTSALTCRYNANGRLRYASLPAYAMSGTEILS
eukprot:662614-Rhodomonas_salina.6